MPQTGKLFIYQDSFGGKSYICLEGGLNKVTRGKIDSPQPRVLLVPRFQERRMKLLCMRPREG